MSLIIRRTEPSDAKALQSVYSYKQAYSQTFHLPSSMLAIWEKNLSNIPENIYSYVAELDDEIVGNIGLDVIKNPRQRHIGRLWIAIKDSQHGKGIGTAMFETVMDLADNWLNLTRIELTVFTDNKKAIALYKKFGFEIEGEAKNFAFRNGEFVNAYYMARIKSQ